MEEGCEVVYKCSDTYAAEYDDGVAWDSAGIDWPLPAGVEPRLSDKDRQLLPENTRLRKTSGGDFEVLIASVVKASHHGDTKESKWALEGPYSGKTLCLVYGDHSTEMDKVAKNLAQAKQFALNKTEVNMLDEYIVAFEQGSAQAHVQSQRHWMKVAVTSEASVPTLARVTSYGLRSFYHFGRWPDQNLHLALALSPSLGRAQTLVAHWHALLQREGPGP